ncbi:uncharacterized protein LOC125238537 [Leguminivora glycinivorella]|uniref:uncharacterized protein LOC125238537 n=1 Tax=Leguminivora glycinivorella TaxID=1035111 RepID=UPI00200E749B|nr:uncharacterized protein LOC125238537 [Leguminivora glycinivorella]
MTSKDLMKFEKAMESMEPMEVNDNLEKTLEFLKRNNSELYFPSISPYVEAFLVNLVTDTRNLRCKAFKQADRLLAEKIIEVLEMSREVFRWTHTYENGNILVYKKIFSNKIKKKPVKLRSLLLEKVPKNSNISKKGKEKPVTNNKVSEIKNKVEVQKVKNLSNSSQKENKDCNIQTEQTLSNSFLDPYYADAATAVPSLSLLSNITEKFFSKTVTALTDFADNENCKMKTFSQLSEGEIEFVKEVLSFAGTISVRDMFMPKYRILLWKLDRIVKRARHTCELTYTVVEKDRSITWIKRQKSASAISTSADTESSPLPPLELLTNITEDFFKETVKDLTHFADDATIASWTFCQLTGEQILFVKNIRQLAGTTRIRELFDSNYRDMLWRLNYSINEAASTSKITSSVNEKERSITLKKTPKFAAPAPVPPKVQPNVATGTRSKSMGQMKTTDRSLSRDRLIQFEKGGKTTDTIDLTVTTDDAPKQKPERGRSMNRRTAKLLEDLATPVESDIGMRMMMLMGWQGGALGVRGDGIMEPVMPNIDQPKRGGLGHVPPPKIVPRKPIDFRQMLIHNLLDFLLHDDWKKDIVFKEPLVKKEQKFLNNLLTSVNRRRKMSLTEKENELIAKMYSRLADYPTVELKGELSQDLKTITLQKLVDRPLRGIIKIPKSKIPPLPPLQPAPKLVKRTWNWSYQGRMSPTYIHI